MLSNTCEIRNGVDFLANMVSSVTAWCLAFAILLAARNSQIWDGNSQLLRVGFVFIATLPPLLAGMLAGSITSHVVDNETSAVVAGFVASTAVMLVLGLNTERLFW